MDNATASDLIKLAKRKKSRRWKNPNRLSGKANIILNVIFILMTIACILPIVIVISVSFSTEATILREGYGVLPKNFSLDTFRFVLRDPSVIISAYSVTIVTTVIGTLFCLITVALFAYPLSRPDFKFRTEVTFFMFFTMLFNGGLVSYYIMMTGFLGLRNNILAMILPYSFNAFWVIVMRTFYKNQVPDSIIESARTDGAGEWRTLIQIVLPISLPGLATIALFTALAIWNEFINCLLFIQRQDLRNLQTMIYQALTSARMLRDIVASGMGSSDAISEVRNLPNETFRMALSVITIGPIVLVYPFFQRFFIKGLTIGSIKG